MRQLYQPVAVVLMVGLVVQAAPAAVAPESFDGESTEETQYGRSVSPSGSTAGVKDLNLNVGAVLDSLQTVHTEPADDESNRFELRSFEVNVGGAVDPHFDARATFAFHDGEVEFEEGYVLADLPAWTGAKIQFGKEKLNLGYLNRFHGHDFPQIDGPVAFEKMLGEEGVALEGGHLQWLTPLRDNVTLGLETGLYNGFGGKHDNEEDHGHGGLGEQFADGKRPYHLRGTTFYESRDQTHGVVAGLSYLDVLDNEIENTTGADSSAGFTAVDLKYRYRPPGSSSQLTLAGEWYQNEGIPGTAGSGGDETENFTGWYTYAQYDLDRYWGIGSRYGQSEHLNNSKTVQNSTFYGEYRPSEFSRIRLQAKQNTHPNQPDEAILGLQGTVFLGWHPAHRF